MKNQEARAAFVQPMEFRWNFFWPGQVNDCIQMENEPVFGDGPGFQRGDEIEFIADDRLRTVIRARVIRRVFDINSGNVRVYLEKLA